MGTLCWYAATMTAHHVVMPPRGWRKPKPELSAQKERSLLLQKSGLDVDAKAILLGAALDAIRAGLGLAPSSPPADGAFTVTLEQRLRAASMALGLLGVKPSRNPMAPTPAPQPLDDEPADDWTTGGGATPAKPSLRGRVDGPEDGVD